MTDQERKQAIECSTQKGHRILWFNVERNGVESAFCDTCKRFYGPVPLR